MTRGAGYLLSPIQEGMLFHHVMDAHAGIDVEQLVCSLPDGIDETPFRIAWLRALERHTALRTSFCWEGLDRPIQLVHERVELPFTMHDWRHLGDAEQRQALDAFLAADRRQGFDASSCPLLRVTCFRLADARSVCVWTVHHLICDARSSVTVLGEVFEAYDASRAGRDASFAPARPYREFIRWLERRDRAAAESFWRARLAGVRAPTPLPGEARRGNAADGAAPGECRAPLSQATTAALTALAARHDVTLSTIVQGAWAILLSRYAETEDVIFGVARACRRAPLGGADDVVGVFINTLPMRVRVSAGARIAPWLEEIRAQQLAIRDVEHTPLIDVQRVSEMPGGIALFETLVVFDRQSLQGALRARDRSWAQREVRVIEKTGFPLTLYAYGEPEWQLMLAYDSSRFAHGAAERLLGQLRTLLEGMAHQNGTLGELSLLSETERHEQLVTWNATTQTYPGDRCVHELLEEQADRTPDAVALACGEEEITYRELDAGANRLGHRLRALGVGPGTLVGICLDRSIEMVVSVLAILKAGGAYVPLDPSYPQERLRLIMEDSAVRVVVTESSLETRLPSHRAAVVALDRERVRIEAESSERGTKVVSAQDLGYVIYTSGSTGRPKGVMVEHRNVVNLLAAMDQRLARPSDGVWLAVTSLSFDIAALELFWPLARGLKLVLATDELTPGPRVRRHEGVEFSLMYFAADEGEQATDKYRLLLDGARFADEHGFAAVWTPERHFHAFGGLYPNPAVTSAAIATITNRVGIRGGSCVLPLHHPARVVEEWSVVDNLSSGRVGVAFASGWQPNDFVLMPGNQREARTILRRNLEMVRKLWRGEEVTFPGPTGDVSVRTLPRPVQPELPFWITAAGSPETFRFAGECGASILTHLLGQTVDDVASKIEIYRRAWREAGHRGKGHVTLMAHTFVGDDVAAVREQVREPLRAYLRSAADLIQQFAANFRGFKQRDVPGEEVVDFRKLPPEDMEALLDYSFERYFETSALLGTPTGCLSMVQRLREVGVDEIACLIDFGVPTDTVLRHLHHLDQLRQLTAAADAESTAGERSIGGLIRRHRVTHLQCTPSAARLLAADPDTRGALQSLHQLLVGGEALPPALASELRSLVGGELLNMYGPTETTVWSSCHMVQKSDDPVPIGRPIGNTELFVLDERRQLLPVGVPGELFIGGDGVARGYLHDARLTAQRFEPHPFRNGSARVFRTGDVVKYRHDGCLLFLGRTDHQAKVRGHRIELGEIENVLAQHPAVRQAVVTARDGPTGATLVAYYVAAPGIEPPIRELREHLARHLLAAMVPTAFVALETLPLTPNGKIDRRALPDPIARGSQPDEKEPSPPPTAHPRTRIEEALVQIWSEVLGTPHVGVHDSFFDLGGDSLALIRVGSRIQSVLNVKVPLRAVLDAPTVAQLAAAIERLAAQRASDGALAGSRA